MNLGATIKTLRIQKGFNQETFAKKCSISQTYLSQIENNRKEPNLSTLNSISQSLDIPLAFIFLLGMESKDIKPVKRDAFEKLKPALDSFVNNVVRKIK
jgi:XRE family transcriptional regulator, regulator of sulfur utilization